QQLKNEMSDMAADVSNLSRALLALQAEIKKLKAATPAIPAEPFPGLGLSEGGPRSSYSSFKGASSGPSSSFKKADRFDYGGDAAGEEEAGFPEDSQAPSPPPKRARLSSKSEDQYTS